MAKVKFVLKEPNAEKETLVYLMFTFNNQRLKYSTSEFIHPDYWHKINRRAKETKAFPEYPEFNSRLDMIEAAVKNAYRRMLNDKMDIDTESLRKELEKELKGESKESSLSLLEFIDKYIQECKTIKSPLTIKAYKTSKVHLEGYCNHVGKTIQFEDIDLEFYNSFISYLATEVNLSHNSIGKEIKDLKVFLNEATERGLNTKLDYKKKKFKKLTEENDKVYLNQQEIEKIYNLDLNNSGYLDKARDIFILGCCTGLRFSDLSQIKDENIFDGNKLRIRTHKTSELVVIPLHRYVREILKKHNNDLPRIISNQKMNDYIKKLAAKAGINEVIESSITKGGKLTKETLEKSELVTSHTARRSFATNMYLAGVPTIAIMKITGHRTEKSFLRYIRISQEENANILLNHPFFK